MNCNTARLLLDLLLPSGHELDRDESEAINEHLASCSACSALAHSERQFHQRVSLAMRQVEAPASLRTSLLDRLEKERTEYYRKQVARGTRLVAGLAACLLIAFLFWYIRAGQKPAFNVDAARQDVFETQISDPTRQKVDEFLANHHVAAPKDFNYRFLVHYGMIECQGHQVPYLLFVRPEQNLSARVYLVSDKQFNPASLQEQPRSGSGGYSSEVRRAAGANYAYVIIYTGEDLRPFLVTDDRPPT